MDEPHGLQELSVDARPGGSLSATHNEQNSTAQCDSQLMQSPLISTHRNAIESQCARQDIRRLHHEEGIRDRLCVSGKLCCISSRVCVCVC